MGATFCHRPPPHPHALSSDIWLWAAPYGKPGLFSSRRELQRAHYKASLHWQEELITPCTKLYFKDNKVCQLNHVTLCPSHPLRMTCLAAICLTQAWMMWKFINFQLKKWREHSQNQASKKKTVSPKSKLHKKEPTRSEYSGASASG